MNRQTWKTFGQCKITWVGNGFLIFVMLVVLNPTGDQDTRWLIFGLCSAAFFYAASYLVSVRPLTQNSNDVS